jgi:hypothetical protein
MNDISYKTSVLMAAAALERAEEHLAAAKVAKAARVCNLKLFNKYPAEIEKGNKTGVKLLEITDLVTEAKNNLLNLIP